MSVETVRNHMCWKMYINIYSVYAFTFISDKQKYSFFTQNIADLLVNATTYIVAGL